MEYRQLGNSGLRVPVLSFGAATFGGVFLGRGCCDQMIFDCASNTIAVMHPIMIVWKYLIFTSTHGVGFRCGVIARLTFA